MRLLLIFALLLASIGLGAPATAHAGGDVGNQQARSCHGDSPREGQGSDGETGKTHAAVHVCPGCAFFGQPASGGAAPAPIALPRLPANPASMRSFQTNPIPPPPRLS